MSIHATDATSAPDEPHPEAETPKPTPNTDRAMALAFSPAFANMGRVAPMQINPETGALRLVTDTPDTGSIAPEILRFLLYPSAVECAVVSPEEFTKAQAEFKSLRDRVLNTAKPKTRLTINTNGIKPIAKASCPPKTSAFRVATGSEKPSAPLPPLPGYNEMGPGLVAAITMLAQEKLRSSTTLTTVQARVRYGRLLAARLNLPANQTDAVVVAGWLSGLPDAPELLSRIPNPYHLEQLIDPTHTGEPPRVEAHILEVVRAYETLCQESPEKERDVVATRHRLNAMVSGEPDVIEPFLQILMDEQFLASLDRKSGMILLADSADLATGTLAVPLRADGYRVETASDAAAVRTSIATLKPDAIILAASLAGGALGLCRELRRQNATRLIPLLILDDQCDDKQTAEFLRAGVDDVLPRALTAEIMLLKIDRLLGRQAESPNRDGVVGLLRDMAFADMIQIFAAGSRNLEIRLTKDRQEGLVYMQEGSVIHAACPPHEGAPAFYELMRWREGSFITLPCSRFPERTIHDTTMGLLMEGARLSDERQEAGG